MKNLKNLGTNLSKEEQREVKGGLGKIIRNICDYPGAGCPSPDNRYCATIFCI